MKARLRTVIVTLAFGLLLVPLASEAQQAAKIPRVGFLGPGSVPPLQAFRRGLANLGYVEGRDIIIEPRFAEGRLVIQ